MDLTKTRRKLLFFDWRDIDCGSVSWRTPDGETVDVEGSATREFDMHAEPVGVPHGIWLQVQPAQKTDPVDDWRGWGRTIHHHGKYRSWFLEIDGNSKLGTGSSAQRVDRRVVSVCGVESDDGIHWSEPTRCPIDVPGQCGFDGVTFLIDPVASPDARYKLVYCARVPDSLAKPLHAAYLQRPLRHRDARVGDRPGHCLMCTTSPDGVHWSPCPRPLMMHPSDTDTTVYWDAEIERYVMYTRMYREGRRWIGRAEAEDFFSWGPIAPVVWPRLDDPPDYDFYLNGRSSYPGLPEYQLLFPMVYHRYTERSEVRLYVSADGVAWNQVPGGPIVEPGESGSWDSEFIGGGKDLLPFGAGRVAIPYTGTRYPHKYPRWPSVWDAWKAAWAGWPEDRLCAIVADREGEFRTLPMLSSGRTLRVNCRTRRAGEVRIGIVGGVERSVNDCDPIHGDHAGVKVSWKGVSNPGFRDGEPIRLHVRLRCAELFALEWTSR